MWDVVTCPCPSYLLVVQHSWYVTMAFNVLYRQMLELWSSSTNMMADLTVLWSMYNRHGTQSENIKRGFNCNCVSIHHSVKKWTQIHLHGMFWWEFGVHIILLLNIPWGLPYNVPRYLTGAIQLAKQVECCYVIIVFVTSVSAGQICGTMIHIGIRLLHIPNLEVIGLSVGY